MGVSLGDWELDALVSADRAVEDDPFAGVLRGPLHEPVAIADAFRCDQDPLGVPAVDDVAETFALLADQVLGWDFQVVDVDRGRLMIDHQVERLDLDRAIGSMQVDQKDGQTFGLILKLVVGSGAGQKQHQVGVRHA